MSWFLITLCLYRLSNDFRIIKQKPLSVGAQNDIIHWAEKPQFNAFKLIDTLASPPIDMQLVEIRETMAHAYQNNDFEMH